MAENFDLIFGQNASQQYAWNDSDYQNGWETIGNIPPTAAQFDALQRRSDTKMKELNDELTPLVNADTADSRQPSTAYSVDDIKYSSLLPTGWFLTCTTAGTTSTGALVVPDPLNENDTINDGTVVWTLHKISTQATLGYRQPGTTYAVGDIAFHTALPAGFYLECTTAGTAGAGDLSIPVTTAGTNVADGSVVWTICANIGTNNIPQFVGYNGKQTFTSSGSFTAPVTGTYKITLQGGGGGGAGAGASADAGKRGGGGGGQGGHEVFYERLTAGQSYNFTIGAGGAGGAANAHGSIGGASSITIGDNAYVANGGDFGRTSTGYMYSLAGLGGTFTINGTVISQGASGIQGGVSVSNLYGIGGTGGGIGGTCAIIGNRTTNAIAGGGGGGGTYGNSIVAAGGDGGDGYITFEWIDTSLL